MKFPLTLDRSEDQQRSGSNARALPEPRITHSREKRLGLSRNSEENPGRVPHGNTPPEPESSGEALQAKVRHMDKLPLIHPGTPLRQDLKLGVLIPNEKGEKERRK